MSVDELKQYTDLGIEIIPVTEGEYHAKWTSAGTIIIVDGTKERLPFELLRSFMSIHAHHAIKIASLDGSTLNASMTISKQAPED